ncbi:MAG TPA: hypothetical protein VGR05_08875 [Sphingomicrobium sp.]|nr:hypothetical protein [Sphingomicrobium sp.]
MIDESRFPALLEPRQPLRAILVGWLVTTIPALLLSVLVSSLLPQAAGPEFGAIGMEMFVRLVVFAPLVETLIMAALLELLLLMMPPRFTVIASSVGWGIAHSFIAVGWGLVIWWPFLIFSTLYVTWRGQGRVNAMAIVFAVHALNNLGPALLLLRSA